MTTINSIEITCPFNAYVYNEDELLRRILQPSYVKTTFEKADNIINIVYKINFTKEDIKSLIKLRDKLTTIINNMENALE